MATDRGQATRQHVEVSMRISEPSEMFTKEQSWIKSLTEGACKSQASLERPRRPQLKTQNTRATMSILG